MADEGSKTELGELTAALEAAARTIASPNDELAAAADRLREVVGRVEEAAPGGAPLHAQLDNVRRWLGVLEEPSVHERFGGAAHLREQLVLQVRIAVAALEDYVRASR